MSTPSIGALADAALVNVKLVKLQPSQHALVIVFDEAGNLQVRGTDGADVTRTVGALARASFAIHSLRSLQTFDRPG